MATTHDLSLDWVTVPSGSVTLCNDWDARRHTWLGAVGATKSFELPAFQITRHPVTNRQYAGFVEAGGYQDRQWWTPSGWKANREGWIFWEMGSYYNGSPDPWEAPTYWGQDLHTGAEQPVVGVSWYEALAFSRWAQAQLDPEALQGRLTLPSEQQWQRAAQARPDGSDSGRVFAWGDAWRAEACNHSVPPQRSAGPSPVDAFAELGSSPCGVVDLCGNVWEWCLTDYTTGDDVETDDTRKERHLRTIRGGSFGLGDPAFFQSTGRDATDPHDRKINFVGIRLVRSTG